MLIELTGTEALLIQSAIEDRINLFKKSGLEELGKKDPDEKELNSIIQKIDNAFENMYKGAV